MKPEPRALRSPPIAVAIVVTVATLAAEEAVEEVLHVALVLLSSSSPSACGVALAAAVAVDGGLLGQGLGVDVDDGGADLLDDLREAVGEGDGRGDDEGLCVGGVDGCCSLPLTLWVRTEPTRMPTESVASRVKVVARRRPRMRSSRLGEVRIGVSIGGFLPHFVRYGAPVPRRRGETLSIVAFQLPRLYSPVRSVYREAIDAFRLFRRESQTKVYGLRRDGLGSSGGVADEFGYGDSGEDEGGSERARGPRCSWRKRREVRAGEDGFESQEERGVGGREMLLGPALDGEGGGGGEEAGDGQGDEKTRSDGEVRPAAKGESDGHDEGGGADLEGGERAVGTRCEVWARESRCPAKAMAQTRVRKSPRPMLEKRFCQVVPVGVVRNSRPVKARSAPRAVVQRGAWALAGRRMGTRVKRGTKTTTRPVMKADLAAVVRARPAVWNW